MRRAPRGRDASATLPPELADAPLLVVQPHPDDAALSTFALLQRPAPTTVLTVFGGRPEPAITTYWDDRLGFADSTAAMTTRLAEDAEMVQMLGLGYRCLPLLESAYRSPVEAVDLDLLVEEVRSWVSCAGDGAAVALPVGAGGALRPLARVRHHLPFRPPLGLPGHGGPHVDHLLVTDHLLAALAPDSVSVLLYEEVPYRWSGRGDERAEALARGRSCREHVVDLPVSKVAKAQIVGCYRSQAGSLFARRWAGRLEAVLPGRERYWVLGRSA